MNDASWHPDRRDWLRAAVLGAMLVSVLAYREGWACFLHRFGICVHRPPVDGRLAQAEAGNPAARYALAFEVLEARSARLSEAQARAYMAAAAAGGHAQAQAYLAQAATDPATARALATAAAEGGDRPSLLLAARAHDRPGGDPVAALKYYLLAAVEGPSLEQEVRAARRRLGPAQRAAALRAALAWQAAYAGAPAPREPRRARYVTVLPGPPGPRVATQIGGVPWWSAGRPRPACGLHGTPGRFVAQVLSTDVPGWPTGPTLLTLHVCPTCGLDWDARGHGGYAVTLLPVAASRASRGAVALREVTEDREGEGELATAAMAPVDLATYGDPPRPGSAGENGTKLGGWPRWVQAPAWPSCDHGRRTRFVAQVEGVLGGGDSVYLFVCPPECPTPRGEMVAQS